MHGVSRMVCRRLSDTYLGRHLGIDIGTILFHEFGRQSKVPEKV